MPESPRSWALILLHCYEGWLIICCFWRVRYHNTQNWYFCSVHISLLYTLFPYLVEKQVCLVLKSCYFSLFLFVFKSSVKKFLDISLVLKVDKIWHYFTIWTLSASSKAWVLSKYFLRTILSRKHQDEIANEETHHKVRECQHCKKDLCCNLQS